MWNEFLCVHTLKIVTASVNMDCVGGAEFVFGIMYTIFNCRIVDRVLNNDRSRWFLVNDDHFHSQTAAKTTLTINYKIRKAFYRHKPRTSFKTNLRKKKLKRKTTRKQYIPNDDQVECINRAHNSPIRNSVCYKRICIHWRIQSVW